MRPSDLGVVFLNHKSERIEYNYNDRFVVEWVDVVGRTFHRPQHNSRGLQPDAACSAGYNDDIDDSVILRKSLLSKVAVPCKQKKCYG